MSTKNGKKSRNRRHEEAPTSFKQPTPTISIDDIPLPSKSPIKKNINPPTEPTEPPAITINNPINQDTDSPNGNGSTSRDTNKSRTRSNTPQSGKKIPAMNFGNGNGKTADEEVSLANGGGAYGDGNGKGDGQQQEMVNDSNDHSVEIIMEPLILDSNETEPELLNLGGGESDSSQQEDQISKSSTSVTRCTTRRSQTRYIPTPETPHSGEVGDATLVLVSEEIAQVVPLEEDGEKSATNTFTKTPPQPDEQLLSTPTITITPCTPPIPPTQQQQLFETSSTHSDTNLSTDSTTDNCSTHAVVGSDITRMNIDEQLTLPSTEEEEDVDTDVAESRAEEEEQHQPERVDGKGWYEFDLSDESARPRSREGSVARTLTGRKSIRPGTDYRKYLLGRGLSGEGSYTSTLGSRPSTPSTSYGMKRKITPTDFSTSTPTTLKRRKLDTVPNQTFNWFSYISQPFYSFKNRFSRSILNINTELPQTNITPKLTAYNKLNTKTNLEKELDTVDYSSQEGVEDNLVDVSLGVEAMVGDMLVDKSGALDGSEAAKEKAEEIKKIPVACEIDNVAGNRKSCAIM